MMHNNFPSLRLIRARNYPYYLLSLVAVALSAIRFSYLPELETILLLLVLLLPLPDKFKASLLVVVLCSHFLSIQDSFYRFNYSEYPSIYTKSILFGLKSVDYISVVLFLFNLPRGFRLFRLLHLPIPWFLVIIAIISTLYSLSTLTIPDALDQTGQGILFTIRSVLLVVGVYLLASDLSRDELGHIAILAIFTWTSKMVSAIIIPHENPITRETFALSGTLYFSGSEYLNLPTYLAIVLSFYTNRLRFRQYLWIVGWIFFVLVLSLFAQRRSSLLYAFLSWFMVAGTFLRIQWLNRVMSVFWMIFIELNRPTLFLIVFVLLPYTPLHEDFAINRDIFIDGVYRVQTLLREDPYTTLFGTGVGVPYEASDMEEHIAHRPGAWGETRWSDYRKRLWYFPFGRLIMITGAVGFVVYVMFLVRLSTSLRYFSTFYLFMYIYPLCYLSDSFDVIQSATMGFALAALVLLYRDQRLFGNRSRSLDNP